MLALRRLRLPGFQIARQCGLSRATVSRLLRRHQLHRLALLDPPPPVQRYCREHPGELIHFDIKKLARIERVGHRVTGNRQRDHTRGAGYEYVHVAIDDASRIAYARLMPDEGQHSALAFLHAAIAYFRSLGIQAQSIMSDNGSCYISKRLAQTCRALGLRHLFTRPYTPRTNGKAERFIDDHFARMGLRAHLPPLLPPRRPSAALPPPLQLASTARRTRPPASHLQTPSQHE